VNGPFEESFPLLIKFFTANGVIGIALFAFALADLVLLQGLRF